MITGGRHWQLSPPDNAVVLCVDEKSQIQPLERKQPVLPMIFGKPERKTPSYLRRGTTTLLAALDIATGAALGRTYPHHRAIEFRKFLNAMYATRFFCKCSPCPA